MLYMQHISYPDSAAYRAACDRGESLAAEVGDHRFGMRVVRLHRVIARFYEQALTKKRLGRRDRDLGHGTSDVRDNFHNTADAAGEQCAWPVRYKSMPLEGVGGFVLLDGSQASGIHAGGQSRASGQVAGYPLVAASDGRRTRTVICMRSLKPSFS